MANQVSKLIADYPKAYSHNFYEKCYFKPIKKFQIPICRCCVMRLHEIQFDAPSDPYYSTAWVPSCLHFDVQNVAAAVLAIGLSTICSALVRLHLVCREGSVLLGLFKVKINQQNPFLVANRERLSSPCLFFFRPLPFTSFPQLGWITSLCSASWLHST